MKVAVSQFFSDQTRIVYYYYMPAGDYACNLTVTGESEDKTRVVLSSLECELSESLYLDVKKKKSKNL